METAVSAGRIDRNASDSDSAVPVEVGSVKDKIGRFTDNPSAAGSINPSAMDSRDKSHSPLRVTGHDPLGHNSQKPAVPRKPVMLASTEPPDPTEIPSTKPPLNQAEPQKRPPFINELMGNHAGARPAAPTHNGDRQSPSSQPSASSNKPSPLSAEPRPKLPPRTGTSSDEQSSISVSSKHSLPQHIDGKPRLPARRETPPIPRTNTDTQGIILEDNETPRNPLRPVMRIPPTRSLTANTSSLLDEPSIMTEPGAPKPAGTWPLAADREPPPARKVPPPPPRQRRAGPQGERKISPPSDSTKPLKTEITQPEQTRYESAWAANKGLHVPSPNDPFYDKYPPGASEMVLNLVVRDIWSRSCLPSNVLQRIWDLVDRQNVRLLTREEFVVGMWLIDRVLEGARLPAEVPGSVWCSLRSSSKVDLL